MVERPPVKRVVGGSIPSLFAMFLLACSSIPEPPGDPMGSPLKVEAGTGIIHGDAAFSPEERLVIEAANVETAAFTGRRAYAIVWDGYGDRDTCRAPGIVRRGHDEGGATLDQAIMCLFVGMDSSEWFLPRLMMHEFGHWYGMCHTPGAGVMNADETGPEWTDADRAEAASPCKQ